MKSQILIALVALTLPACGGGGSSPSAAIPAPVASATAFPVQSPSAAPSASPSPVPVAAIKVLQAAPLSSTPRVSSKGRIAQAGVSSSLPILVESSGPIAVWAGNFVVWVTDAVTGQDVAETGGTITATNGLPVTNPTFETLPCPASSPSWCGVHPLGWEFGTADTLNKPVGKQALTVSFADGVTGVIPDYIYDGWEITCGHGIVYVNGVPTSTTTEAASDIYADCSSGNLKFPKGAILASSPVRDYSGRLETILPTLTAEIFISSGVGFAPMASIAEGQVYGVNTQDGGMAKIYMASGSSTTTTIALEAMSLHSKTDLTYDF